MRNNMQQSTAEGTLYSQIDGCLGDTALLYRIRKFTTTKSRAAIEVPYSTQNSLTFETSEVLKCV